MAAHTDDRRTPARGSQNADGPPTLTQVAQAVKALIDDLALKVRS